MTKTKASLAGFLWGDRGQALTEFAIVIPVVLLFFFAALVGFTVRKWRFPLTVLLALSPVAAEWSSEHLKVFRTELSVTAPNLLTIAVVAFVLAYIASLVGGGIRSMVDAGTR